MRGKSLFITKTDRPQPPEVSSSIVIVKPPLERARGLIDLLSLRALPRIQPRGDIHTPQLLKQQFRRIRQIYLADLIFVVAVLAFEGIFLQLRHHSHKTADVADVHSEWIGDIEETFFEE